MARTDNDTWDLASSVGATATMVAAARAIASKGPDAIIDDPFAEPLVRAVGVDFFTRLASGELSPAEIDQQAADQQGAQAGDQQGKQPGVQHFADTMAARTRFFDEFFADAGQAGIRQAVILAAGLDSRAYRLPWPDGTVVYEIDQPDVIEFKSRTMAELGATPTADRRTVPMDLRFDWPAALAEAGFDRTKPTAWIAEGLFGYLPPDAQDRLLDQITELSPAGSRIAVEGVPKTDLEDEEAVHQRMQDASDHWRAHGFDLDFSELVYLGDRADVTTYLEGHDWQTSAIPGNDLLVKYGLTPVDPDDSNAPFVQVLYISASK